MASFHFYLIIFPIYGYFIGCYSPLTYSFFIDIILYRVLSPSMTDDIYLGGFSLAYTIYYY